LKAGVLAAAALAVPCLGGCAGSGGAVTPGDVTAGGLAGRDNAPVKIALLLPLAGFDQTAVVAKAMKQAGEMAIFERENPRVQLIVKDDKGTAEGAAAAAGEAIADGAEIVIGPLFAAAVEGAAPVARRAKVPILALSNDPRIAGDGVWLVSYLVEPEIDRIVSFTVGQGRRRFAALIPDDAYGRVVEPAFRRAVARAGGTVEHLRTYSVAGNGPLEPAKQVFSAIARADGTAEAVDALFLPGGQDLLPNLGPLVTYSGLDTRKVKLIGTGAWDFPNLGRDEAFAGGWYPGPDPRGWRAFSERFAKTFGTAPPRLAVLAYDAVGIAVALSDAPAGARFTAANLTRSAGFSGVDGVVRLSPAGTSSRDLAILEVQRFESGLVEEAVTGSRAGQVPGGGLNLR
jgi:ABC-type branched-subunit amino acid transport system substrate-binding protein